MNRRSGLPRGFPRWLVWLTAWVIALSALAPTISRALAHAGSVQWVQVCTSEGIRWIALSDADNGADSGEAGKSALHLDHCPLCVLMGERLAPPKRPFWRWSAWRTPLLLPFCGTPFGRSPCAPPIRADLPLCPLPPSRPDLAGRAAPFFHSLFPAAIPNSGQRLARSRAGRATRRQPKEHRQ